MDEVPAHPPTQKKRCVICGERNAFGYAVMPHIKDGRNAMYYCAKDQLRVSTLCKYAVFLSVQRHKGNPYFIEQYESLWADDLDPEKFPHPDSFKNI